MRKSLIVSIGLHVAVLMWALIEFPLAREFDVTEMPSVPIDIVTPSEFTKIKAGTKDAKTDEPSAKEKPAEKPNDAKKEAPKKPEMTAALAPKPEPKEVEPEPAPKPKKAEEPKPEPKTEAEAAPPPLPMPAPPKPKVVKKKKPEKPKKAVKRDPPRKQSEFDADRIAALLNKVPDTGPKAAPKPLEPQARPETPTRGQSSGQDLAMTLNELDALRARISQCWIPPVGGMGAEQIKVRLRMRLNPDGTLSSPPEVVGREPSPYFQVAADSAVRAVWQCQPYQLPAAKYAVWRDMILNFDPSAMFGG